MAAQTAVLAAHRGSAESQSHPIRELGFRPHRASVKDEESARLQGQLPQIPGQALHALGDDAGGQPFNRYNSVDTHGTFNTHNGVDSTTTVSFNFKDLNTSRPQEPDSAGNHSSVHWSPRASQHSKKTSAYSRSGLGSQPEMTRDSREVSESGTASRFTEEDVHKTLQELQSLFRDEAEEARRQKQNELRRLAQKRAGVRTLIGAGGSHLDLGEIDGPRARAHRILTWIWFDFIMGIVITANAATIGIQASMKASATSDGSPSDMEIVLLWMDAVFLIIYSIELGFRVFTYRLAVFKNNWVRFDAFLVCSGIVDFAVTALADNSGVLNQVMMVRLLRLTRLARIVRFLSQFRVLWALVQGMSHSLTTLVWTFFLIFTLLYTFAILGNDLIEVIDVDDDQNNSTRHAYNIAARKFDGLTRSMLTLAQFLTFDTVGEIYRPLITERPWLAIYFVIFALVCSIALMNLVIAVMVENHMEQSRNDKNAERLREEKKKKKLLPKLRDMFDDLDTNGSGDIDWDEIRNADPVTKQFLQEIGKGLDLEELFHMLDFDTCGTLDINEFCDGLIKAATSNKPLELLRLLSVCSEILQIIRGGLDFANDVSRKLTTGVRMNRRSARTLDNLMKARKSVLVQRGEPRPDAGSGGSTSPPVQLSPSKPPEDSESLAQQGSEDVTDLSKSRKRSKTVTLATLPESLPIETQVQSLSHEIHQVKAKLSGMDDRMESCERGLDLILAHVCKSPPKPAQEPEHLHVATDSGVVREESFLYVSDMDGHLESQMV